MRYRLKQIEVEAFRGARDKLKISLDSPLVTLFRSPVPGILQAKESLPDEVARLLERVAERPERFAWIVPTGRRKRALVQDWVSFDL
jgi:hypothetical protein